MPVYSPWMVDNTMSEAAQRTALAGNPGNTPNDSYNLFRKQIGDYARQRGLQIVSTTEQKGMGGNARQVLTLTDPKTGQEVIPDFTNQQQGVRQPQQGMLQNQSQQQRRYPMQQPQQQMGQQSYPMQQQVPMQQQQVQQQYSNMGKQGMFGGTATQRTPYSQYSQYQPYQGQQRTQGMFGAPTMNYSMRNRPMQPLQQQSFSQNNPWSS